MRYDTPITFVKQTGSYYDFETGETVDGQPHYYYELANVTDLGTQRSVAIFGDIKENAKVIRLLNQYTGGFDTIEIEDVVYKVIKTLDLRRKQTLIAQEVSQ